MARYVVLSVEDNDKVDILLSTIPQGVGIETVAVMAQPTQFHRYGECPGRGRVQGWVRGLTFGWWVCADCKKPAQPMGKTTGAKAENLMRHVVSQAVNLLPEAPNQLATVNDEGWGTTKAELRAEAT